MANPKTFIPVALLWLGTLAAAFWWGMRSGGGEPRLSRPAAPAPVIAPEPAPEPEPEPPEAGAVGRPAIEVIADAAAELRGGIVSQRRVLEVFARMGELDGESVLDALAAVEALEPGSAARDVLLLAVLGRWAELDGALAMRYAEENLEGGARLGSITNVASSWAESDPEGALAWYRARASGGELEQLFGSSTAAAGLLTPIFNALAERSPDAALAELGAVAGGDERRSALGGLTAAMVAAGEGELLLAHLGRLPKEGQSEARRVVLRQWAGVAPEGASAWVARMSPSAERAALAKEVGLQWIRREPRRAIAWLLAHTPSEHHPAHLAEGTAIWARADPNSTAEWLAALQPGPGADPAIAAFARQIVQRDPESAFAWASTISDGSMRQQASESVFAQWAIREPKVASAFLDGAELPDSQMEVLRALLPGSGRGGR